MAESVVSKLVRVRQGRSIVQFELADKGLTVEYYARSGQRPIKVILGGPAVTALRELLGGKVPISVDEGPGDRPSGSVPREGLQTRPTEEGLTHTEDGAEAGMG